MVDDRSINHNIDCPSDETLTLWVDGLLSSEERLKVDNHAKGCALCGDLLETLSHVSREKNSPKESPTLQPLVSSARQIIKQAWENQIVTILLRISKDVYSAAETTGRVLFAPWLESGLALRANGDENQSAVVVETLYRNMRCLVESSRTPEGCHTIKAVFTVVDTNQPIEPTVFVLFEDNEEIESQMSVEGKVIFEDLPPGAYRLMMTLADGSQANLDLHLIPS